MQPTKTRRSSRSTPSTDKTKKAKPKRTAVKSKHSQCRYGSVYDRLREPLAEAGVTLIQGDSRVEMTKMRENSIDCIICDPPYGLSAGCDLAGLLGHWLRGEEHAGAKAGFMGKGWDKGVPSPALWREALRVLKPGGHCLAFGGSRTSYLTQVSLEFAGFEVRDTLTWHYSTGMPKSKSLGHALGHKSKSAVATALAPSQETIIVARKPLERGKGLAANALAWQGCGGLNIDGARIGTAQTSASGPPGRWPKNTLFSHDAECQFLGMEDTSGNAHSPAQKVRGFGVFWGRQGGSHGEGPPSRTRAGREMGVCGRLPRGRPGGPAGRPPRAPLPGLRRQRATHRGAGAAPARPRGDHRWQAARDGVDARAPRRGAVLPLHPQARTG